MKQEDKELLLKDLCARLPYHVIVEYRGANVDLTQYARSVKIENCKPYLHPISSMTEEEKDELRQEQIKDEKLFTECITKAANGDSSMRGKVVPHFAVDWCNKNHFDYRGLIEKGLALEAPEGIYEN